MRNFWQKIWQAILTPPAWLVIVNLIVTLASAVGAVLIALTDFQSGWIVLFAYSLFALAALSLAYTVYLCFRVAPKIKVAITRWANEYEFTHELIKNFGFRTIVFSIVSLAISVAFAFFNGGMGIYYQSIWYGALAAYYLFLVVMRAWLLLSHRRGTKREDETKNQLARAKTYRACGIILLFLNLALSTAIAQMIFQDAAFYYADWTIYAFAAYAFFKITMSIINLVRAKRQDNLTVRAIRNINFTDSTVSILALQTALLATFATGEVNASHFNTVTGCAVSIVTVTVAIIMITTATKKIKEISTENNHG